MKIPNMHLNWNKRKIKPFNVNVIRLPKPVTQKAK